MIKGAEGISATIIADSVCSETGTRLTTFELEYPRFIHSELMTHRMLSKNCASSRAIPINKMLQLVNDNPALPVWWGKNQPGMSAKEELEDKIAAKVFWLEGLRHAVQTVEELNEVGLHKQIANRVTEPWQRMKTVITGTEWANLLWLRDHEDAQPEFAVLAACIRQEFENSVPEVLEPGEWHVPYVRTEQGPLGRKYFADEYVEISAEDALKLSSSCCAQVSYRKNDESLAKAKDIYDKLVGSDRKHASPFEHQGTPMKRHVPFTSWAKGVTHIDREMYFWSGNFKNWIQHRQLIDGHAVW